MSRTVNQNYLLLPITKRDLQLVAQAVVTRNVNHQRTAAMVKLLSHYFLYAEQRTRSVSIQDVSLLALGKLATNRMPKWNWSWSLRKQITRALLYVVERLL